MRLRLALLALLAASPAAAQSNAPYQDLNNTWMHYHLTNGYNVRADLARTRRFMERFRLQQDSERKEDDDYDIFMTFRADRVPTIPGGDDSYTFLTYGFNFVQPPPEEGEDSFSYEGSIGLGMVDRETEQGQSTKAVNFLLSAQGTYGVWVTLGVELTANLVTAGPNVMGLDQLSFFGRIPFLGAFTDVRYDLGSQQVRNVESGVTYDFTGDKLGILTAAYYHRAPYQITGDIFPGFFDQPGHSALLVEGEHGGFLRWERVGPFGGKDAGLVGGLGLGLGTNTGVLRFAYGDLGFQYEIARVFARFGAAYARLQATHELGGGGGAEVYFLDGNLVVQGVVGRNDVEVVDRAGQTDGITFSLSVSGAFR